MTWFTGLSIRYKILLVVFIAMSGYAVNLAFNFSVTNSNAARLQDVRDVYFPVLERIDANQVRLDKIKETLNAAASSGEMDILRSADQLAEELRKAFTEVAELDASTQGGITTQTKQFEAYYSVARDITRQMIDGSLQAEQIGARVGTMTTELKAFSDTLKSFRWASYQRFTETIDAAKDAADQALKLGLVISLVVMVIVGIIGLLVSLMITRSISDVAASLEEIASGESDLTKRLPNRSRDELGQLVNSFNSFMTKLQDIIANVANSTTQLSAAAEEIATISEDSNHRVHQQHRETEQVATSMNEMTATVQEVARSATQASEAALNASNEAGKGHQVVEQTIKSINALATEVETAAGVIHCLESDSSKIGMVLDVIRGISEQTNLLALNAAIEAARAGEQGRGFAVVADEVRTLASRTRQSTLEIQTMIESLQTGAVEAVKVMEQGRNQAHSSVDQASKAGESLRMITHAVETINGMNDQIASAAEEQSVVAEEINRNITTISQLGDQTASAATQISTASSHLAALANQLQMLVGKFKIQ